MRGRAAGTAVALVVLTAAPATASGGTGGVTHGHGAQIYRQNAPAHSGGHHRGGSSRGGTRSHTWLPEVRTSRSKLPVVPPPPSVQWTWDTPPHDEAWDACIQPDTDCGTTDEAEGHAAEGHYETVSPTASPTTAPARRRGPTVGQVIEAGRKEVASITMPPPVAMIQPSGGTVLVRMPTNFSLDASPYVRTVTLLGVPLTVTIYPDTFTWDTGDDGAIGPTIDPGGLYPNATTTHTYTRPGTYPVTLTTSFYSTLTVPGYGTILLPGRGSVGQTVGTLTATTAHGRLEAATGH